MTKEKSITTEELSKFISLSLETLKNTMQHIMENETGTVAIECVNRRNADMALYIFESISTILLLKRGLSYDEIDETNKRLIFFLSAIDYLEPVEKEEKETKDLKS